MGYRVCGGWKRFLDCRTCGSRAGRNGGSGMQGVEELLRQMSQKLPCIHGEYFGSWPIPFCTSYPREIVP